MMKIIKRAFLLVLCTIVILSSVIAVSAYDNNETKNETQEAVETNTETSIENNNQQEKNEFENSVDHVTDEVVGGTGDVQEAASNKNEVTFSKIVDGVQILVKAKDETILPKDAILNVEKVENNIKQIKETFKDDLIKDKTSIQDMMVFDITFTKNNEIIQPNGHVEVELRNTGYDSQQGISVYHVSDDYKTSTNMNATFDSREISFDTTHFSQYVIVNKGTQDLQVTIEHYLDEGDKVSKLYLDKTVTVPSGTIGGKLKEFTAEDDDYKLRDTNPIVIRENDIEKAVDQDEIFVDQNTTIRCYYSAKEGTYTNGTTFFDYDIQTKETITNTKEFAKDGKEWGDFQFSNKTINGCLLKDGRIYSCYTDESNKGSLLYTMKKGDIFTKDGTKYTWIGDSKATYSTKQAGINNINNYSKDSNNQNRMIMRYIGTDENKYTCYLPGKNKDGSPSGTNYNINDDYGKDQPVISGIVKGLDANDQSKVVFGKDIYEPGFFSQQQKLGKRIIDDYKLKFTKKGNSYQLKSVSDDKNKTVVDNLNKFWPLDENKGDDDLYQSGENDGGGKHNWFFGMRYDFEFSLGDYVGDLSYSFNGDDDLWVLLDGETVLDLGGIHSGYPKNNVGGDRYYEDWLTAYPNTIDLWTKLAPQGRESLSPEQRKQKHTITVLYMERGGYGSNCEMNFVIPNATPVTPIVSAEPKTDLTVNKVDLNTNNGIQGAEFTLYEDYKDGKLVNELQKVTSNESGELKLASLKKGTYYLKETKQPNGYALSDMIFKVVVKVENNVATTKLTTLTGTPVDKIYNQKYEDIIIKDKTAHVINWDDRTYNITLNASSNLKKVKYADPIDITFVFDKSKSMRFRSDLDFYKKTTVNQLNKNKVYYTIDSEAAATVRRVWYENQTWYSCDDSVWDYKTNKIESNSFKKQMNTNTTYTFYTTNDQNDRLTYLQKAANDFIDQLTGISKESNVGLVTFASSASQDVSMNALETNNNQLKNTINGLYDQLESGTNQASGLSEVEKMLSNSNIKNNGRKKYVILLTDGCPTQTTAEMIENQATALKKNTGATLITIDVGLFDTNKDLKNAKELMGKIASLDSQGKAYHYSTEQAKQLNGVFKSILQTIFTGIVVMADIKDYIDPRFEVDEESVKAVGGTIGKDEKGTYVIWKDQTLGVKVDDIPGWSKTFIVKAQEDYIGGNNVTTNGEGSGVIIDDKLLEFNRPTVNVKATLSITNKEITIYKGDEIPTNPTLAQIEQYINKYGITNENFEMHWYTDKNLTNEIKNMDKYPQSDTDYYLQVIYKTETTSDESKTNTEGHYVGDATSTGYAVNDKKHIDEKIADNTPYGIYRIHMIDGKLDIIKHVDNKVDYDRTFTFTLKRGNEVIGDHFEVIVPANELEGSYSKTMKDKNELKNLSRGKYQIIENESDDYELSQVAITNEKNNSYIRLIKEDEQFKGAEVTLGNDRNNKNVIKDYEYTKTGGTVGIVEFTNNELSKWKIMKVDQEGTKALKNAKFTLKSASKTYTGISQTNGYVEWTYDGKNIDKIEKGTYTLEEVKAPEGYVKSDEKWTLVIGNKGKIISIKNSKNEDVIAESSSENGKLQLYKYKNTISFSLPESGGMGIYWYMIAGMLLMMAASILYKNRYNELKKK